jgi:hypothetical protein
MMRLTALALVVCTLLAPAFSQQAAEFSSYHSGKRYDFRLTHEQLLETPAWLEDEPNSPLSPRSAQQAARSYLRTLFDQTGNWRLEEIKLVPIGERWVYVVSFTAPPPADVQEYMSSPFAIVVTMDGNAVPAVVSSWKPTTPSSLTEPPR